MTKFKMFAMTGLAAAAIGVGGLAAAPSASAKPMSCSTAMGIANHYTVLGDMWLNVFGSPARASYYYGMASGLMAAAC